ncbi:MAG: methionyl-tRNA formyltransferase [Acidobacteriota bacterium]|jgi:methionyl-tRNA formyltransferase|nr:methionyl-tRNA formyltransferase [Acidobacteriota bacterium]
MRLIFMGTPHAAVPTLRRCLEDGHDVVAVWTQPDKPVGRSGKPAASPVKEFALEHELVVHQPQKIRTQEAIDLFTSQGADAAIVVAYGRILPASFLEAPRRGCINVHFSLLPLYRGAAPVNWAIVRGEHETGVSTMFIEEELDSGPVLLQRTTAIGERETAPELMSRLSLTGAELLSETLAQLDDLEAQPQNEDKATFAPLLRKEDGLINWSLTSEQIERHVRGFQPWPNAYTRYASQHLIIWKAETAQHEDRQRRDGEVVKASGDELILACGEDTCLRLEEVQPEGKKRMLVRDFLNGTRIRAGEQLG